MRKKETVSAMTVYQRIRSVEERGLRITRILTKYFGQNKRRLSVTEMKPGLSKVRLAARQEAPDSPLRWAPRAISPPLVRLPACWTFGYADYFDHTILQINRIAIK